MKININSLVRIDIIYHEMKQEKSLMKNLFLEFFSRWMMK